MCNGIYTGVSGGGLICAAVQLLLDRTKLMPGRIMVSLVVTGAVLGFLGIYEPFAQWAGAGATVPLTGFGNTLWKGIARAMGEDGILGIFRAASQPAPWESPEPWDLGIWAPWYLSRR